MQYTLQQLKDKVFSEVYKVYDVFKDFFGEENVDLQNVPSNDSFAESAERYWRGDLAAYDFPDRDEFERFRHGFIYSPRHILVHWPEVTVTNELDNSVRIWDLYAKIPITLHGRFADWTFMLNRSTYNKEQWRSGYMHSHVPSVVRSDGRYTRGFQTPCLGTGPINGTIHTLHNAPGFDPVIWMLFCNELDMYVHVESIEGRPYHRLEEIGMSLGSVNNCHNDFHAAMFKDFCRGSYHPDLESIKQMFRDFIKYFLEHGDMRFRFYKGAFSIGMSYYDWCVCLSNSFIEWFNKGNAPFSYEYLLAQGIIGQVKVRSRVFFDSSCSEDVFPPVGERLFDFKGSPVCLKVFDMPANDSDLNSVTLLNHSISMAILENILASVNYNFRYYDVIERKQAEEGGETIPPRDTENVRFIGYK